MKLSARNQFKGTVIAIDEGAVAYCGGQRPLMRS